MEHIFSLWSLSKTPSTSIGASWSSTSNSDATWALLNLFFLLSPPPISPQIERQSCQASLLVLLLRSSYFFSSRPICQRVSPSHHSVWQTDYLWVVSHSTASLQPSSPAGRDTPCNTAVTLQMKRGPMSPGTGEAWGEYFSWLRSLRSHVVISIAISGCKVNFNSQEEVWPWIWRSYFCFNQM